jgi:hypothetical protein
MFDSASRRRIMPRACLYKARHRGIRFAATEVQRVDRTPAPSRALSLMVWVTIPPWVGPSLFGMSAYRTVRSG